MAKQLMFFHESYRSIDSTYAEYRIKCENLGNELLSHMPNSVQVCKRSGGLNDGHTQTSLLEKKLS